MLCTLYRPSCFANWPRKNQPTNIARQITSGWNWRISHSYPYRNLIHRICLGSPRFIPSSSNVFAQQTCGRYLSVSISSTNWAPRQLRVHTSTMDKRSLLLDLWPRWREAFIRFLCWGEQNSWSVARDLACVWTHGPWKSTVVFRSIRKVVWGVTPSYELNLS
jgi:hypothetical protein